jgi:Fe2+ transport system protein FeoA
MNRQIPLSGMKKGEKGRISSVNDDDLAFGLMSLGLVAGDVFTLTDMAPLGGPLALEVRNGKIAIRRKDAEQIICLVDDE